MRKGSTMSCQLVLEISPPLTSSVEDSPARTSASRARAPVSQALVLDFGLSTLESFANYDPASSSWRTSQRSLLEEWTPYSETWPKQGTMRSGVAFAPVTLAPHTDENGCSLWPTPCASNPNDGESLETWQARNARLREKKTNGNGMGTPLSIAARAWPTASATDYKGVSRPGQRRGQLEEAGKWPTPTRSDCTGPGAGPAKQGGPNLRTAVRETWPTPRACSAMAATITPEAVEKAADGFPSLETEVVIAGSGEAGQVLNADWVESLMGFPPGWCDGLPAPEKTRKPGKPRERSIVPRASSPVACDHSTDCETEQSASKPSVTPSSRKSRKKSDAG